jgi:hypothetical protein
MRSDSLIFLFIVQVSTLLHYEKSILRALMLKYPGNVHIFCNALGRGESPYGQYQANGELNIFALRVGGLKFQKIASRNI